MRLWWSSRDRNADLVAFEGEFLTFQVDRELEPEHRAQVEAHLPEGLHFKAELFVEHEITPDEALHSYIQELGYAPRRHVYCGRLVSPQEGLKHLRTLLSTTLPSASSHHHRLAVRVPRHVHIMSPDLPHFQAITSDISLTGISMRTDAPLEPDQKLRLHVRFEEAPLDPLDVIARVRWCRPINPESRTDGYLVGAHFEDLTRHDRSELEQFVQAALTGDPLASNSER